jgi:membrane-associated phospholipid phosphatase
MEKRSAKFLIFLIGLFLIPQGGFAQNFDINTLKKTNLNRNKNLDVFFCAVSASDNFTAVGLPISTYAIGLIKKNEKLQQQALVNIAALGINTALTVGIKYAVARPRPVISYPYLTPISPLTKNSFPSGHTSLAFCTAMHFSLSTKKWYYVAPAFGYAALVGYSRMHIGVHYPSDVVAGAFIGAGSAYLAHFINKKLKGKKWYTKKVSALTF